MEPSYHTIKHFKQNLLAIEMKRTKILMNKLVWVLLWLCETKIWRKQDVETRFDTSNYEIESLPIGKTEKVIGLMKVELNGKIMAEFSTLEPKTYSFLTDDSNENKKAKGTKNCVTKQKLKFEDYKHCLEATQFENKINYPENKKLI